MLEIKPTWGIQKIFQQYRAALGALNDGNAHGKLTIARFRQANSGVEHRLRAKLSGRMGPIDLPACWGRGDRLGLTMPHAG